MGPLVVRAGGSPHPRGALASWPGSACWPRALKASASGSGKAGAVQLGFAVTDSASVGGFFKEESHPGPGPSHAPCGQAVPTAGDHHPGTGTSIVVTVSQEAQVLPSPAQASRNRGISAPPGPAGEAKYYALSGG